MKAIIQVIESLAVDFRVKTLEFDSTILPLDILPPPS
jgi:hypothetical protein